MTRNKKRGERSPDLLISGTKFNLEKICYLCVEAAGQVVARKSRVKM